MGALLGCSNNTIFAQKLKMRLIRPFFGWRNLKDVLDGHVLENTLLVEHFATLLLTTLDHRKLMFDDLFT